MIRDRALHGVILGLLAGGGWLAATGASTAIDLPSFLDSSSTVPASRKCFFDKVRVSGFMAVRGETYVFGGPDGYRIAAVLVQPGDAVKADQDAIRLEPLSDGGAAGRAGQPQQQPPNITLKAPAAGTVSHSTARVGALASGRAEPLLRITTDPDLDLVVDIPSAYVSRVRAGGVARILNDDGTDTETKIRIAPSDVDRVTQFGRARIGFPSGPGLRAGQFGRALVDTDETCGLAVPTGAILRQNNFTSVLVVKDGKSEVRRVEIGLSSSDFVEVRSGVAEGESVVANAAGAF